MPKETINIDYQKPTHKNGIFAAMQKTTNTRMAKHILSVCVILFALIPCTIKEALLGSLNVEYAKPLNKSKTTTTTKLCHYSQNENQQISITKETKINQELQLIDFSAKPNFVISSAKIYAKYSKTFSGNSPPKYILYKRLKVNIA